MATTADQAGPPPRGRSLSEERVDEGVLDAKRTLKRQQHSALAGIHHAVAAVDEGDGDHTLQRPSGIERRRGHAHLGGTKHPPDPVGVDGDVPPDRIFFGFRRRAVGAGDGDERAGLVEGRFGRWAVGDDGKTTWSVVDDDLTLGLVKFIEGFEHPQLHGRTSEFHSVMPGG